LKIRSLTTIFIFIVYLFLSPISQLEAQQTVKRIAVLELQGQGVSEAEAKTLTDRLRSRLVNTNAFHVLEREQMDEVLQEQGFQQSGCVSDECLVEIGRLVGVEQMVGGSIGKIGQTYTLDLRIIDVTSGRIVKTVSDDYRGDADGLLEVLESAAQQIAGEKVKPKSSGSNSWLYWVGAGVLIAGGAAALLLAGDKASSGDNGGSDLPGIDGLNWPPAP
jgi:TolB-like protein